MLFILKNLLQELYELIEENIQSILIGKAEIEDKINENLIKFPNDERLIQMKEMMKEIFKEPYIPAPGDVNNGLINMFSKMKFVKGKIREWTRNSRNDRMGRRDKYKKEFSSLDAVIDSGNGSDVVVKQRLEILIFGKPSDGRATVDMQYPKTIDADQQEDLERDVSNEEIKKAVWDCGTDKSPGPDGFTFIFYRHFWTTIEKDVVEAVKHFFSKAKFPKGCNSSFIALIPKTHDANMVKDFRPICLIGSIYKIIAKILTNRLVGVLGDIVSEVQSAFVEGRQILDGPFILNEVLQWCKRKKKKSIIFKVDFEKAYDSVRWDYLDEVLRKFGFGNKWCSWIQECLISSRGSILLNGSPTEEFDFFKGLKQGDPLSPFLFILIMESLHISFQRVANAGLFSGLKLNQMVTISHMLYADDAIFVGEWSDRNITTLIHVLECFYQASGLRINMSKSKLLGVNVDDDHVKQAAFKLGCLLLKCPFLYLGTKVGGSMSRVDSWNEVVDKVKARLSKWKMKTLSIGGRLTLLKSVLGSIPIFHMSIFRVPASVLKKMESIRSHFFNGIELGSKKPIWVKWNDVLKDKDRGGLGVASLYALNRGLMIKWCWKFFNQKTSLWTRVIKAIYGEDGQINSMEVSGIRSCWKNIVMEVKNLRSQGIMVDDFMQLKIGNGELISFWNDNWQGGGTLKSIVPRLYALENCKEIKVNEKLRDFNLTDSFRRHPRGGFEISQLNVLKELADKINLVPIEDRWKWSLNSLGDFSVSSIRKVIDINRIPSFISKTRWVKYVPIKVNILAWKIKLDALPTRLNISRRGMDILCLECPCCGSGVESSDHLFFKCDLVRRIASKISEWWNVPYADCNSYEEWSAWLVSLHLGVKSKLMFEGIFYTLWWFIWFYRNKLIFDANPPLKAMIYDNVISSSFFWCRFRSKKPFSRVEWYKNPHLIVM
ncbi:RNA-directed DNA polymerase, eukaryota, reverse transcriptase zinc-binding domain protein [Tanacetum coccineum]